MASSRSPKMYLYFSAIIKVKHTWVAKDKEKLKMTQMFDIFVLIISGLNLLFHLLGAYLLISVYTKRKKKTVQQLLLINLSITELCTSLIIVTETSVKMTEVGHSTGSAGIKISNETLCSFNSYNNSNNSTSNNNSYSSKNNNSYNLNPLPCTHRNISLEGPGGLGNSSSNVSGGASGSNNQSGMADFSCAGSSN